MTTEVNKTESKAPNRQWPVTLGVNICRLVLAVTFIFSGFVKAVDPLGMQYKLHDYAVAMNLDRWVPDWATLAAAVLLGLFEFSIGIYLLFAIRRKRTALLTAIFMAIMTLLTVWIAIANPVSDCGCFGDAIVLTNEQTLLKNIVLMAAAAVVLIWPLRMPRLISKSNQWIVRNYAGLFILIVSTISLYDLPMFDFRPYHIGANLRKGMEIPNGAEEPEFSTTFIMQKDGVQKEFTLDNYPDSTWTFVDSHTVQTKEGYVPPIHDFSMTPIGTDQDIVTDPNRLSRSWLNDTRKNGTCTDVAVLTNRCTATENSTHINHSTSTNFSTDIDYSTHHNDSIVFDSYLVTDDSAWFDTCIKVTFIKQWNS